MTKGDLMADCPAIDEMRTKVWLTQIRALTGLKSIHSLALHFDPKSVWRDDQGIPHQAKWYRYEKGLSVPSLSLTERVNTQLPSRTFEVHHPVWRLLRNPNSSDGTINRLVSNMPLLWRRSLRKLCDCARVHPRINSDFVETFKLTACSYLDALLLLEIARRIAFSRGSGNIENLCLLVLGLPTLYVCDPFWAYQTQEERMLSLATIESAFRTEASFMDGVRFPVRRLAQAMAMQQVLFERHKRRHPRALSDRERQIRFLTRRLCAEPNEPYAIATSAYLSENRNGNLFRLNGWQTRISSEVYWEWAWMRIESDAKYFEFSGCIPKMRSSSSLRNP